jgi:hypothetical protein
MLIPIGFDYLPSVETPYGKVVYRLKAAFDPDKRWYEKCLCIKTITAQRPLRTTSIKLDVFPTLSNEFSQLDNAGSELHHF